MKTSNVVLVLKVMLIVGLAFAAVTAVDTVWNSGNSGEFLPSVEAGGKNCEEPDGCPDLPRCCPVDP